MHITLTRRVEMRRNLRKQVRRTQYSQTRRSELSMTNSALLVAADSKEDSTLLDLASTSLNSHKQVSMWVISATFSQASLVVGGCVEVVTLL